ncbi:hypothetical protein SUNI508_09499 [Seiridium unicorne]|uniref:SnoaL-like domain-containing protein n=1 Tax=Seiridium unicorne TaxID=138068 RepID=A0ABR2UR73_9PEZI
MIPPPSATEIIRRKKQQYCRFADTNQWELFDQIMLPEVTVEFVDRSGSVLTDGGVTWAVSSREEWKAFCIKIFQGLQTIHIVGEGELEQNGPEEIKAIWGLLYHVGSEESGGMHSTGGGYYYETWKRQGDDWFLQSIRTQRLFFKTVGV